MSSSLLYTEEELDAAVRRTYAQCNYNTWTIERRQEMPRRVLWRALGPVRRTREEAMQDPGDFISGNDRICLWSSAFPWRLSYAEASADIVSATGHAPVGLVEAAVLLALGAAEEQDG
jgi:hypothetical protein